MNNLQSDKNDWHCTKHNAVGNTGYCPFCKEKEIMKISDHALEREHANNNTMGVMTVERMKELATKSQSLEEGADIWNYLKYYLQTHEDDQVQTITCMYLVNWLYEELKKLKH